jgi:chromosome segregation ATPase
MEEIEARLTALESQMRHVREDAAAARVLAGGADRDVDEFRDEIRDFRQATVGSLNALRETQIEQGDRLTGVEQRLDRIEQRMDQTSQRMEHGFGTLATGQAEITALLTRLIEPETGE